MADRLYSEGLPTPTSPVSPAGPPSPISLSRPDGPSWPTSTRILPNLITNQPIYSGAFSADPDNDPNQDVEPPNQGSPSPIIFPMYQRSDSEDTKASKSTILSRMLLLSPRDPPSPQSSFRPHELRNSMLKSENANDHLRRIHITTAQYCRTRNNGQVFITFSVSDSALPRMTNLLILDRNGRRVAKPDGTDDAQHIARCWAFDLRSLAERIQPPGRFYISPVKEEQEFFSQTGFDGHDVVSELTLPSDPAFSLDHLLVLASGLATPLRFRYPQATQARDWYPKSVWEAMQLVSAFIQNEEPLPAPLQLRDATMDGALLEKVLAKYADNLRKYRSQVMRRQQREDSDPAVQEKRQLETEAEVKRHNQEIEKQKKESTRLQQESERLAREKQEMLDEIERLKGKIE